jgi:hypothetical protein
MLHVELQKGEGDLESFFFRRCSQCFRGENNKREEEQGLREERRS